MGLRITGTAGNDTLVEGEDQVSIVADDPDAPMTVVPRLGQPLLAYTYGGDDTVILSATADNTGGGNRINTGTGNDTVTTEFQGSNRIRLGDGDDRYDGHVFNEIMAVGSLKPAGDIVYGGRGADRFEVQTIQSLFYGESGDDLFVTDTTFEPGPNGNVFFGGTGTDTVRYIVYAESPFNLVVNLDKKYAYVSWKPSQKDTLIGIENIVGSGTNDRLIGSAVANVIEGGEYNDVIKGLGGNDTLYGDSIVLDIFNLDGDDRLSGGAGKDRLYGGDGADIIDGGTGADVFVFRSAGETGYGSTRDIIKDFRHGDKDRIDLSLVDADSKIKGDQDFDFIGKSAFSKQAGELNFRFGVLSGDTDGDGKADFIVKLLGVKTLYLDDLLL